MFNIQRSTAFWKGSSWTIILLYTATTIHSHHDRADTGQLVIEMASLLDVTCLKGDLKAGAAHTKPHAVHVDVVRLGAPSSTTIVVAELLNERRGSTSILEHCTRIKIINYHVYLLKGDMGCG